MKATFKAVDSFCEKAEKLLRKNNLDDYIFPIQMLLREALTNAVVHGCRKIPSLMIKSTIIIFENEIIIEIEDPGDGFDWKSGKERDYSLSAESGRGLLIFQKYQAVKCHILIVHHLNHCNNWISFFGIDPVLRGPRC